MKGLQGTGGGTRLQRFLQGRSPGPGGGQAFQGYDLAAQLAGRAQEDPYEAAAQREYELGRRFPVAYEAAARSSVAPYDSHRDHYSLASDHAIVVGASIAGNRQTHHGGFGVDGTVGTGLVGDRYVSARQAAAYRPGGFSDQMHDPYTSVQEAARRYSGRLTAPSAFSTYVWKDRPFLHLRCIGGDALVEVTAGSHGGMETSRLFLLGGLVATFNFSGFDTVKVRVRAMDAAAEVQYSWVSDAFQAGDQTLIQARRVTATVQDTVPEGAWGMVLEDADATWMWGTSTPADGGGPIAPVVSILSNTVVRVMGNSYTPSVNNVAVFMLNSI